MSFKARYESNKIHSEDAFTMTQAKQVKNAGNHKIDRATKNSNTIF